MDREHNAFRIQLKRMDDKLALYPFLPFRLAQLAGFGWQVCMWKFVPQTWADKFVVVRVTNEWGITIKIATIYTK